MGANAVRIEADEIERRVRLLESFVQDIGDFHTGETRRDRTELKSRINRSLHAVRDLVIEAGCMQLMTVSPPPALGGVVHRNIDPFTSIFHEYYGRSFIPTVIEIVEQTIGVMQAPGYAERIAATSDEPELIVTRGLQRVERLCRRFPLVARQLQARHGGRKTLEIDDEYDVQDLFHALLRIDFDDVRDEEWTPSYAGGSSRMDFLLKAEKIVVEIKKTRKGLGANEVGTELLTDIARYRAHPDCRSLVCFVYDPEHRIGNPRGLEKDLFRSDDDLDVRVIIAPSD